MYHTMHLRCFRPINLTLPILLILLAFAAALLF